MKRIILIIFILTALGCGGGNGSSPQPSTTNLNINGSWAGTYSGTSRLTGIALHLQNIGSSVTGTFITDSNVSGIVNGNLNGDSMSFIMTSTSASCPGSYTGSGTASNSLINFTYSGSDCAGSYSNKSGTLGKLRDNGAIGWSGNWWGTPSVDHYALISLNTTDSVSYTGTLTLTNRADASVFTSDLSGNYGHIAQPISTYMLLTMNNIQGKLSVNEGQPTSGNINFSSFSGDTIDFTMFNFNFPGGGVIFTGDWFKRVP